jgi:hypothetical protein
MKRTAAESQGAQADDGPAVRRVRELPAPLDGIRVSSDPLILLYEGFVNSTECKMLLTMSKAVRERDDGSCELADSNWTAAQRDLVSRVEARIGQLTSCPSHEEEPPLLLLYERRASEGGEDPTRSLGKSLHVDTNGGKPRRFASALLYLSSPAAGGQTVFPLASTTPACLKTATGDAPAREAALAGSRQLLKAGTYHTGNSKKPAARAIEALVQHTPRSHAPPKGASHVATENGVAIRPIAGNLVLFWTRENDGTIAPRSWHGGEVVPHDAGQDKWLLRKFKEIPQAVFDDAAKRSEFVARSRAMHTDTS